MVAVIRGNTYVLAQVRLVADPIGAGLDCLVATATGTATWRGGVGVMAEGSRFTVEYQRAGRPPGGGAGCARPG